MRLLAQKGEFAPRRGHTPWNKGKTRATDSRLAKLGDDRLGSKNSVFSNKDGKSHKDRVTASRKANGTIWPSGRDNHAYGKVYGGGIHRVWWNLPDGRRVSLRSTWEAAFAHWLEENGYSYEYEPRTFDLDGLTYTPDFYLTKIGLWVEVKGYMRPDDQDRIQRFRAAGFKLWVVDSTFFESLGLERNRKEALAA